MHNIVLVDIDNFLDTSIVEQVLTANGFNSVRVCSQSEIEVIVYQQNKPLVFLILYYNFKQLSWILPLLEKVQKQGHIVLNSLQNIFLMCNYPVRAEMLKKNKFIVPNFYYGKTAEIPERFSRNIVYKSMSENLTVLCEKSAIHSLNDKIYIESQIPNRDKLIVTVYNIFGCNYVRLKEDALQTKIKCWQLVSNNDYQYEIDIVNKLQKMFNLAFFNVEFIDGYIIDVNTIANFYYTDHIEPLCAMVKYLKNIK